MRLSRRGKLAVAGLLLVSVLIVFFASHYIQLMLMEHISLKTFIVRMIAANQNLNTSSSMYGSFFDSSWWTMEAVDVLHVLGGLDFIDAEALIQFLTGSDQAGPVDRPMQDNAKDNVESAFLITHTASVLGRLGELPSTLVEKIHDTIVANQNSTSQEDSSWAFWKAFLCETARLMNETEYVNTTFQKQETINDIVDGMWRDTFGVYHVLFYVKALQELQMIEIGDFIRYHISDPTRITFEPEIRYEIPDHTRTMLEFYILSLWDDSRYGFYESIDDSSPKYYEGTLVATYSAVRSYMELAATWGGPEKDALKSKVGFQFENVLTFLSACQNRYGIFFDSPSKVSDEVTSLQIWPTYNAIMLLHYLDQLDFLNQTVRWPPTLTFIESLSD